MEARRFIVWGVLAAEMFVFAYCYVYSTGGLLAVHTLEKETRVIETANRELMQEVNHMEQEIIAWNEDDFYKEKVAREQLQMAYEDEDIYYLT